MSILKRNILLLLIVISNMATCAVEPSKFQFALDFSLSAGFHQRFKTLEDHPVSSQGIYGGYFRHLSLLYNINKKFTSGIGIGLDSYRLAPNAVPIFGTFRHRPIQKSILENFYYYANFGYSIPIVNTLNFAAGWLFDLGIGWQKNFRKHFGINAQLGYGLKEFRTYYGYADFYGYPMAIKLPSKYSIVRNSMVISVGIVI